MCICSEHVYSYSLPESAWKHETESSYFSVYDSEGEGEDREFLYMRWIRHGVCHTHTHTQTCNMWHDWVPCQPVMSSDGWWRHTCLCVCVWGKNWTCDGSRSRGLLSLSLTQCHEPRHGQGCVTAEAVELLLLLERLRDFFQLRRHCEGGKTDNSGAVIFTPWVIRMNGVKGGGGGMDPLPNGH